MFQERLALCQPFLLGETMMSLLIRKMRDGDLDTVIDLQWALNLFENGLSGDRVVGRADAEACVTFNLEQIRLHGGAILIAEIDARIVGCLSLAFAEGHVFVRQELRRHGYIQDIVVTEGWRGQNIAQALMAEAERLTRQEGLRSLSLNVLAGNDRAERAYRRFGFAPHAVEMIKALDEACGASAPEQPAAADTR
jgi:GNAT superfamily N-acetyltransferase